MSDRRWEIVQLAKHHDREGFDCGNTDLDDYLRRFARVNDSRGLTRTFVALERGEPRVCGYYTARSGSIDWEELPDDRTRRRLPRYPVPVFHLARLAVDRSAQGMRLGETLLMHALHNALRVSREVGVYAVEVLAADVTARAFYLRYGFTPLVDDPQHLYLSIKALDEAFAHLPPDEEEDG